MALQVTLSAHEISLLYYGDYNDDNDDIELLLIERKINLKKMLSLNPKFSFHFHDF